MAAERFPIEWGHILMFARAVGDPNPVYEDPERAVAPPTFTMASAQFDPDYFLRPKIGQPWFGSGKEPSGIRREPSGEGGGGGGGGGGRGGGTGLHAEQHFEYHKPLRPGMVLTAEQKPGRSWEKEGKRAGKLVFSEGVTEYRDQDGDLVVTARMVGVRTEKVVGS